MRRLVTSLLMIALLGALAVPVAAQAPTTTGELLSGMITEEVEPGVLRVVNDGVRDLSLPPPGWGGSGLMVDVTPDGSVWLSGGEDGEGLHRLGEEPVFEDPKAYPWYREVAPDSSLWGLGPVSDDGRGIFSFGGTGWTVRATTTDFLTALAVGPDGTVWVMAEDRDKQCPEIEHDECSGTVLLRLEDDDSLTTIEDWADVYDGEVAWYQLAVSPAGDVWVVGTPGGPRQRAALLLRFDGEGWEATPGPDGWDPGEVGRYLDVGPDGTLWVQADASGGLARFDDPGWTTFTVADGRMQWIGQGSSSSTDVLEVAADGSLWLNGGPPDFEGCGGGVTHYDGTTWTSYLVGTCVEDFAIAPDGSVWLAAETAGWAGKPGTMDLYVITPEAVSATT